MGEQKASRLWYDITLNVFRFIQNRTKDRKEVIVSRENLPPPITELIQLANVTFKESRIQS